MGIIWKSAMPLLPTLAALVIIVHSAEEDLEAEYRHDLRPRTLDTGTPSYDQPWRAMESDPQVQQPQHTDNWDNDSPDDIPKRRRSGRKRKRRPQTVPVEEDVQEERFAYPDEPPRPYFDVDFENTRQTTEIPKRRRKKPEMRPIRWTGDVVDLDRPLRRRGQRRKRPSLETWPELSEFRHTAAILHDNVEEKIESTDQVTIDNIQEQTPPEDIVRVYENDHELTEQRPVKLDLNQHATDTEIPLPLDDGEENVEPKTVNLVQDKSLSEFSAEMMMTAPRPTKQGNDQNIKDNNRISNKNSGTLLSDFDKAQENYLMDPLTLKDILKRSNGTSLSEILQQHNLSLTDLLHGKQHAVSIFKTQDSLESQYRNQSDLSNDLSGIKHELRDKDESEEQTLINSETKYVTDPVTEYPTSEEIWTEANKKDNNEPTTTAKTVHDKTPKITTRHRFPIGIRKKLRMRPMLNNTYKGQLSRDLITLNARKYAYHRRNITKTKELKDVLSSTIQNKTHHEQNDKIEPEITTMGTASEELFIQTEIGNNNSSSEEIKLVDDLTSKLDDINMDNVGVTELSMKEIPTEIPITVTEKPKIVAMVRPTVNSSGLRRQSFNNRLKRKRLKHKNATTEPPQDDLIKHLFGLGTLVSSSEFVARTQEPTTIEDDSKDLTTLDDFITTESTRESETAHIYTRATTTKISTTLKPIPSTTEESAKIEIDEILNDTRTSAKLSKILLERNMTLSELVEHRERGSSQLHLADIFHNASREPNPPEPFLSKSLLEPISKETYPLRALLDANSHDPNARAATIDPSMINSINIPVVMDFRNNVNENAENMGIMSLFSNFTKPTNKSTADKVIKDIEERAFDTSIDAVNVTDTNNASETVRESRVLSESPDDVVSWNEIFSLMGRNHQNETPLQIPQGLSSMKPFKGIRLDEDADGDGLIVLEDLQHLKDFDSNIASGSDEKIEVNPYENKEPSQHGAGILDKIPSQTKSVTVATASIAGLAMVLFLLTYAAFKWKQQRSVIRKKRSFRDERIPTPVFENRKGHKNNSSTRSISPMLQTSNIYTLNTLDSQNGKDSPDYMWDTLRKPFQ